MFRFKGENFFEDNESFDKYVYKNILYNTNREVKIKNSKNYKYK